MKTSVILPRNKFFLVLAYLLTLCVAGAISLPPSFGASLSIPGIVSITIQPAEAIAAGARWSIDGGGAPQASGAFVSGVVPGIHTIQFNNLTAWREPDTAQVLVIGGKPVTLTATYRPLPRFYFRTVPEQRARIGTSVEFVVHTDDPGDPQNPGPGTALQLEATPPPSGPLVFDAPSGRITYTPSVSDHLPFTVRLTTPQGLPGSFEMTPINTLAPEDSVIEYDRPLPNAESRDYMQISEVPNAPELFNDAVAETFTVSISGQTLVFAVDHPAHLHRQYSGRLNLRSLRLYADKVIIRSPLVLPQTQVTIQARELRFEGDGRIDTTPRARVRVPLGAGPTAASAQSGDPGHDAGNLDVFVERFFSDSTTSTRFVMRGGNGGQAGDGRNGLTENDLVAQLGVTAGFLSAEWYALMGRSGNTVCGAGGLSEVFLYYEERFNNVVQDICGSRPSTAFGESAVHSGVPGRGGNGGTLRSTINLSAFAQLDGGVPGARGGSYVGAAAPTRRFIYRVTNTRIVNGEELTSTSDTTAPKAAGSNATAPFGSVGSAGSMQVMPNPGVWLHSFSLRSIVQFAKDAYLNGRISETRQLLGEYQELLRAHQRIVGPNEQLTDEEFAENVNLDQLLAEVENLIHRLDSNLDYFGNPAGWVPMLSFEANFLAFQNEVDHAIPILYLTYWLNNAATNLQASLAATVQAKDNLEEERTRLEAAFNEAQSNLPRLKSEAATIAFQITTFQRQLTNKLAQLEQKARDNVAERNKVPLWKKGLGILSVAADLVPIGQPTVGRIGAGIGLLAKIDPDHPIESAKALKPEAFGVMSNKNISVCFGTNAPSNTSTNSGGSTNDVKKAKQERLKRLTECAKFLGAELKEVAGIFKEAQVDSKDLAAELEKLKASDTEFQELILQLQVLNVDKERYAQQLAAALQVIGSFSAGLAENLVATHELEDRIAANLNALDHGALMHIKEMERRTRDRLVQYQYYLAKSFQYRQLRPFTGNLQLTRLFTRFQQLVEANTSHILSPDEFDNLKAIFVDELREMVAQSLDNVNAPARSFPKSYRLNVDQRRQLNQQGYLVLNLKNLGLINPGDENVRLADLRTRTLTVTPTGPIGSLALVRVNYEHLGTSRLTTGGRTFLFRHYQTENANPITWNAIYDAHTGQTVNSTLSAAQQSLISVLLALQPLPVTNLLFFSQPGANAEILLTKDVSSDNGTGFMIDDLLFEIQYDFNATSGSLREMNVRVSGDLAPTIYVSPVDINNRADGVGDFSRVYGSFQVVTLQAPSAYGRYVFDKWMLNNQPYTMFPATAIVLSGNMQVEARYRLPAIPVLAMAAAPRGQIRFSIPSETGSTYVLEQSPRLNNPTWSAVDTRSGDGTTLEFTRPTTSAPNMFYRVRIDRQ